MAIVCIAGQTFTLEFSLEDQSNAGLWKANPTIAAGDFQISVNGGAFENVDNIPTVTPAAGRRVALVISAAETTAAGAGGLIYITGVDASGAQWYDVSFSVRVHAATGDVALTGDAMTLANDAITSAKFDETTAWPLKAQDSGSTYIARTGADSDTLETLSGQLDGVAPAGEYDTEMGRIDQSLSTTESNIRGADSDTLETLSDEIATIDTLLDTTGIVVASFTTAAKAAIESEVDDALGGGTGTALTAIPWNANWDAEVQSECNDALVALDLDHLIQVSAGSEEPTDGAYLDQIMHKSSSQTFDAGTDSLEAIRDTMSSATITTVAAVSGDDITVVPYTTWEFTIDGLSDLSGAAENGVIFTAKENYTDADSAAILQVQEGVGLLYINGAAASDASKASLTVAAGEDEITVHVNASQTAIAENRELVWDIKAIITDSEDADQMATGSFHISHEAVTRDLTV